MENCAEKEEAFIAWNENADEICDKILAEGDSGIIYKHFLCDTKEKLRKTLTDEQKKIFSFLEENIEVFASSAVEEAFEYGYCLCMKKILGK